MTKKIIFGGVFVGALMCGRFCGCRVKPEVLEEVAPLMRTLQGGKSICIHARVDDWASGFNTNKEIEMTKNATNALMQNGKTLFDCAEVSLEIVKYDAIIQAHIGCLAQ